MSHPCNLCYDRGTFQRDPTQEEAMKLTRRLRGQPPKTKMFVKDFCHCKAGRLLRAADRAKPDGSITTKSLSPGDLSANPDNWSRGDADV